MSWLSWPVPHTRREDLKYDLTLWGESIEGTKAALQRLGLGVGMAFPGEPGAPKRRITVQDPRGFSCSIRPCGWGEFPYSASINLPGRETLERECSEFASGVMKTALVWADRYAGTGAALVAAGLVRADQLPGQPGMGKTKVSISPNGAVLRARDSPGAKEPGAKLIERTGKGQYELLVRVSADEEERRREADQRAVAEWEARVHALPRPEPLVDEDGQPSRPRRKALLRLIGGTAHGADEIKPAASPPYRTEGNLIYLHRSVAMQEARP